MAVAAVAGQIPTGAQFTHFAYSPDLGANVLYISIFGLYFVAQFGLGIRYRTWDYMGGMLAGLVLEITGYTSRIFMRADPSARTPFLMDNISLILGPAFLAASIYLCMGRIVMIYGENLSPLKPRAILIIFILCDLTNLILQGVGGAISSTAQGKTKINLGIHIVIAGLTSQVISLLAFMGMCAQFAISVSKRKDEMDGKHEELRRSRLWKAFLFGLSLATLTIFTRSSFRIAELSQGFQGPLANNEATFMTLEGGMMLIATGSLTILHPGLCFQGKWSSKGRAAAHASANSSSDSGEEEKMQKSKLQKCKTIYKRLYIRKNPI